MDAVGWLILIQTVILVVIMYFLIMMLNRLATLIGTLNDQVKSIDEEIKPILQDIQRVISNMEPVSRELGEKGHELGALIENLERVTNDAQVTTSALRNGIVPFAHSIAGIYRGLTEGAKVLSEFSHRNKSDSD